MVLQELRNYSQLSNYGYMVARYCAIRGGMEYRLQRTSKLVVELLDMRLERLSYRYHLSRK